MRRAGLDYHEWANIYHYQDFNEFALQNKDKRIFACTTKTQNSYSNVTYRDDDMFLFGPETRGLPSDVISSYASIRIPMQNHSRSLNLSNSVAIILFEALRQLNFLENK